MPHCCLVRDGNAEVIGHDTAGIMTFASAKMEQRLVVGQSSMMATVQTIQAGRVRAAKLGNSNRHRDA